jgi:hypothetical protein
MNRATRREVLESADTSTLWFGATCRARESGDMSPQSKMPLRSAKHFYGSWSQGLGKIERGLSRNRIVLSPRPFAPAGQTASFRAKRLECGG